MAKKQTEEHKAYLISTRGFPSGYHSKEEYENSIIAKTKVKKNCEQCNSEFEDVPKIKLCSNECRKIVKRQKTIDTNLERYGGVAPLCSSNIKLKTKQTNLKRYGCENPQQNSEVKLKTKQTNLERYGNECHLNSMEYSEKRKASCLERYRS